MGYSLGSLGPRVLPTHNLVSSPEENHDFARTLSQTCAESRAVALEAYENCQGQILPFATELVVQMDLAGTTLNTPHAHASAAAADPGLDAASSVVNPFDSLPDTHCLFEIWHGWQFALGTGPPLRFAHVRGAEMYGFLEEENRNADGSFARWDDYLLAKVRYALEGEGGIVGESSDDEGSIQSWEEREGKEGSDDDDEWI